MDTQITITISAATGEITVSANGQNTPVASLDEAIAAVQAIAQEALGGGEAEAPESGGVARAPADVMADEEVAMIKNYRNKNNRGMM